MPPNKTLLYCVEPHFVLARSAMEWSLKNIVDAGDTLHIVTVLPPVVYSAGPASPIATAGAVNAVTNKWEAQKRRDEMVAADTLKRSAELLEAMDLNLKGRPHTHALPAAGGASGVALTISEYANAREVDLVILGSRGMGTVKSGVLSIVGLGSVSDYVVNNCHCPVLVVRQDCMQTLTVAQPAARAPQRPPDRAGAEEAPAQAPRKICFAFDSTDNSRSMLTWALAHLVRPDTDELHIVTVGKSALQNYPVAEEVMVPGPRGFPDGMALPNLDPDSFTVAQSKSTSEAEVVACEGIKIVQESEAQIPMKQVFYKGLLTEGGASGAGEAICHYAKANGAHILVAANRSLGGFRRALNNLAGMGSVSLYCAHHAPCPVVVFKE